MKLEVLIDVTGTADWRRQKAEEYPHDERNCEAVKLLDEIAKDMAALEGSDLHRQIEGLWVDGTSERFSETVSDQLRSVGFHSWPKSGRELLEAIADRLRS
jgi:hypothetical protein